MTDRWHVTYEIVTPESAVHGDADERGYILQDAPLRDAIEALHQTRTSRVDGVESVEPSDSHHSAARWITVCNGMEYETGAQESRSIHIPDNVTAASRARLCKLIMGERA